MKVEVGEYQLENFKNKFGCFFRVQITVEGKEYCCEATPTLDPFFFKKLQLAEEVTQEDIEELIELAKESAIEKYRGENEKDNTME